MEDLIRDRRVLWIQRFVFFSLFILLFRAFQLQVLCGSKYRSQSEQNHIRQVPINPPRGLIMDRNGKILAENRPAYSLFIIPFDYQQNQIDTTILNQVLQLTPRDISEKIREAGNHPFLPIRLVPDMDFTMLSRFEENRHDLPGMFYEVEALRTYTSGSLASHVLGYVGEVNAEELETHDLPYHFGDIIGKAGVEKQYNLTLWGKRGYRYVEVDVQGRQVGHFKGARDIPPVPGSDIHLTLDYKYQILAEKLLAHQVGALIALNPNNGEILAMTSKPDFHPGIFAVGLSHMQWDSLRTHPKKPLLNRAIQAQLPPGSTFKLVTGAAGLKEKTVQPEDTIRCLGTYKLGRRFFNCWKSEGHGLVNFSDAIKVSCNVYFYQMNLRTDLDSWILMADYFGFGKATQVDLPGEAIGILPNQSYLDEKYGAGKWSRGLLLNLAVGQGDILVTPIQMAQMAAVLSQKSACPVPRIVLGAINDNRHDKQTVRSLLPQNDVFSDENFRVIQNAMCRAVNEAGGTGVSAVVPRILVCGKTGTAENPRGDPHSWFIGFAPSNNPQIVIAVVIEHGGSGSGRAASIAGIFLRTYFSDQVTL